VRCKTTSQKKRFFGDGHKSPEELTSWVGVLKLPLTTCAAAAGVEETVSLFS